MSQVECLRNQQDEFNALAFIYLDEFTILKQASPFKFNILCKPYKGNQFQYQISLQFQFPKTYPKTPLKYQIQPIVGITRDNLSQITQKIQDIIYENRDKPIVYDIVEQTRQWIHDYLVQGKAYEEQQNAQKKIDQVFERPKFAAFTPVTIQSFLLWKKQFDFKHKVQIKEKKQTEIKLTGKQWFLGKKPEEIQESEQDESQQDQEEEAEQKAEQPHEQPQSKLFSWD